MMQYVEAPGSLDALIHPVLFLAGGITKCPDWQRVAVDTLSRAPGLHDVDFSICNPRRSVFDVTNPQAAQQQITWEWRALELADVRLFWFPPSRAEETVQPIALFALGRWSGRLGHLIVGADQDYPRELDVRLQLELERPEIEIQTTLAGALLRAINLLQFLTAIAPVGGNDSCDKS